MTIQKKLYLASCSFSLFFDPDSPDSYRDRGNELLEVPYI
jgi:hypothetical protein